MTFIIVVAKQSHVTCTVSRALFCYRPSITKGNKRDRVLSVTLKSVSCNGRQGSALSMAGYQFLSYVPYPLYYNRYHLRPPAQLPSLLLGWANVCSIGKHNTMRILAVKRGYKCVYSYVDLFHTMVYITAFRVLMPCGPVGGYQRFRRTSWPHTLPKDGSPTFLKHVGNYLPERMVSYQRRTRTAA
jgi:hypothetical protein